MGSDDQGRELEASATNTYEIDVPVTRDAGAPEVKEIELRRGIRTVINHLSRRVRRYGEGEVFISTSKEPRWFPHQSSADLYVRPGFQSDYYKGFISDRDIVEIHCSPVDFSYTSCGGRLKYGINEFNEHVIQQVGWWGCSAATVEMVKMDLGLQPDPMELLLSHLGTSSSRTDRLEKCGFEVFHFSKNFGSSLSLRRNDIALLEDLISRRGSAICSVYPKRLGIHAIIVDNISRAVREARLRDPFHGWSITVTLSSLRKLLRGPLDILQVSNATKIP